MINNKILFSILMILFLFSCTTTKYTYLSNTKTIEEIKATDNRLEKAYYMVLGHFTNEEQAKTEKNMIYSPQEYIAVPLWEERTGEYWIYITVMLLNKPEAPLSQEVWQIERKDPKTISINIYDIPDKAKHTLDWKSENPLVDLKPKDLISNGDCDITLTATEQNKFELASGICKRNISPIMQYVKQKGIVSPEAITLYSTFLNSKQEVVYSYEKGLQFIRVPKSNPRY